MDGESLNIKKDILNKLKELIPNCFTEDKIDWEKFRIFFSDNIEFKNERYHLSWAGKTEAIRILQTPTYKTLKPYKDESLNFDTTENIFIEGDNLEVLKILQKAYFGKIKMIYIDPPYNTGNDFIYKDDYSETLFEYRKKVGDVDENGNDTKAGLFKNTKENGHYHSNWLNMLYPRLFLARSLLRDDGVIFVSIDDNEVHNLRLVMDEIFGEENFIGCLIRKSASNRAMAKNFNVLHEYILCYAKFIHNISLCGEKKDLNIYKNPDNDLNGPWVSTDPSRKGGYVFEFINPYTGKIEIPPKGRGWVFKPDELDTLIKEGKLVFLTEHKEKQRSFILKRYLNENKSEHKLVTSLDICNNDFLNQNGTKEIIKLFNALYFDFPKPVFLIKYLLKTSTNSSDLILDFFAGSGTTAQAVMELNKEDGGNRKFILVQLPEPTDPESEAYKAGYKTIAEITKERIRRAAKKIEQELEKECEQLPLNEKENKKLDLGFKVFKVDESNFKQWRPFIAENEEQIRQAVLDFVQNIKPEATPENMLYELMLKNGKKLTDKIEKKGCFYVINNNELIFLLEEVNMDIINEVIKLKPQKVVVLDKLFNGNDSLKTNTILRLREANIEFKDV